MKIMITSVISIDLSAIIGHIMYVTVQVCMELSTYILNGGGGGGDDDDDDYDDDDVDDDDDDYDK